MIIFELTMPNRGSWNGKWSQENDRHIIIKNERYFPKDIINNILEKRDFYYHWDDGWTACVSVSKINYKEANKLKKISGSFCGYDWMVSSILNYGEIRKPDRSS
jgi:hypothetical protein